MGIDELKRLIRSTTCADLADAVRYMEAEVRAADAVGDDDLARRWELALEELWPRYAEAAEFTWAMSRGR